MCTHLRRIRNKYTGKDLIVKCGHCKACLQEKANMRANRIRAEVDSDHIFLFVTLTYDRMSCPFVYLDDLYQKKDVLNVYRAFDFRYVPQKDKVSGERVYLPRRKYKQTVLGTYYHPDYSSLYAGKFSCLKKFGKRVGVCFYKDFQDFMKRLRQNLIRNYNYDIEKFPFKVFNCDEYGPKTQRPHFHTLFKIRPEFEEIFRAAILKSWPLADRRRSDKYIEIARDCASYVSSYVNSSSYVHPFLSSLAKCKHSYSKRFGFGDKLYSLDEVLKNVDRGSLSYLVKDTGAESELSFIPYPKYVINRYFPIFKGMSRLISHEICESVFDPARLGEFNYRGKDEHDVNVFLDYSQDDLYKIKVRLDHAYEYYNRYTGRTRWQYAQDFVRTWTCYKSTIHRIWRSDTRVCDLYKFDNIVDLFAGAVKDPDFAEYLDKKVEAGAVILLDPNLFPDNVARTLSYSDLFDMKNKSRYVTNSIMDDNNHFV